jgi:hypothetical protein
MAGQVMEKNHSFTGNDQQYGHIVCNIFIFRFSLGIDFEIIEQESDAAEQQQPINHICETQ